MTSLRSSTVLGMGPLGVRTSFGDFSRRQYTTFTSREFRMYPIATGIALRWGNVKVVFGLFFSTYSLLPLGIMCLWWSQKGNHCSSVYTQPASLLFVLHWMKTSCLPWSSEFCQLLLCVLSGWWDLQDHHSEVDRVSMLLRWPGGQWGSWEWLWRCLWIARSVGTQANRVTTSKDTVVSLVSICDLINSS